MLELLDPKPEIIILGAGTATEMPTPEVVEYLERLGIAWEPMNTLNACASFTLLNGEERPVCAALIGMHLSSLPQPPPPALTLCCHALLCCSGGGCAQI